MLLWTRRMQFWHARRKILDKRPNIFRSASKTNIKGINFAEKLFSSNWSFEHLKLSFANPAKKIFTKRPKTFRLFCKKIKKNLLLPKVLLMTKRRQFWQRHRKVFDKSQGLFVHYSNKMVRKRFLEKVIYFTKLVPQPLRTQLWQKRSKFSPRRRKLLAQDPKEIWKIWNFPRIECFIRLFPRTRRRQFWQSRRKRFAWRPKKFHITSEKEEKDQSLKIRILFEILPRTPKNPLLTISPRNFRPKAGQFWAM